MSPLLRTVMQEFFSNHPGGQLAFCEEPNISLTAQMAAHHFVWAVAGGKWDKLHGWHTLRHSFISNCAARGVDQRSIDAWVGHTTEAMRQRYRHLFPDEQKKELELVFGK
jgi:integrase